MQEKLKLEERVIKLPKCGINTAMLNSSSDFLVSLNKFNNDYNTSIEVQNAGRWKQGSYDTFKALAIQSFNPRLKKAKNIKSIFQNHTWAFNKLRDDLQQLDNSLKGIRNSGIKFNDDNDTEGKNRFDSFINNLEQSLKVHPDIHIDISKIPWFNRNHHSRYDRPKPPSQPIFNKNGQLIDYNNKEDLDKHYEDTMNPMNIYLNIAIPINDIMIKIFHQKANDKLLYEQEYGSLMVGLTISIFDAIFIWRRAERNINTNSRHLEQYFSGTTQQFPLYSKYQHPFISSSSNGYNAYGTGNTCFGDLTQKILISICSGELSTTHLLLRMWSETYPKNNVNPLNQYTRFIFGVPLDFKKGYEDDIIGHSSDRCKDQIHLYSEEISRQDFIDTFCSNCKQLSSCQVYKNWTYVPHKLSESETVLLNALACSIYNTNSTVQNWGTLPKVNKLVQDTFLFFNRIYHASPNDYDKGFRRVLSKYHIRNRGLGHFVSKDVWTPLQHKIINDQELTVSDFIELYHMGELIWYSSISEEHNIPIEGDISYKSTPEEIKSTISTLRSIHLNLQRRAGTPTEELKTYASNVLYI